MSSRTGDVPPTGYSPLAVLRDSPMSWLQIRAVGTTFLANTADGFDILAITFAIPGIAREWGASPVSLGAAISAGMAGMALGSLILGGLADRFGRRPVMLYATLAIATGMLLTAFVTNIFALCVMRFLTGLGIGALLSPMVIAAEEFANERRKNFCLGLMGIGVPIGGVVGGIAAMILLELFDWRAVFIAGSALTFLASASVLLFLPETIPFLMARRPRGFLQKVTRQLQAMGHSDVSIQVDDQVDEMTPDRTKAIVARDVNFYKIATILCAIFCGHIITFYFIVGWMPKMVLDLGFSESEAASASTAFSAVSIVSMLLLGVVRGRNGLIGTLLAIYIGSAALVCLFGALQPDLLMLQLVAGACGFFANPGVVATYALVIGSFKVELRSTALGFVIGIGRGASVLAPLAAGYLFAAGADRQNVSVIFAGGSALAAVGLLAFVRHLGRFLDPRQAPPEIPIPAKAPAK